MLDLDVTLFLMALESSIGRGNSCEKSRRYRSRQKPYCKLNGVLGGKNVYLFSPGLLGKWAPMNGAPTEERDLSQYVDDNVKRIIRESLVYKHIKKSRDNDFANVSLGTVSGNVLCYLRNNCGKNKCFTMKELVEIIKIASSEMLEVQCEFEK